MAIEDGVMRVDDGQFLVDHAALQRPHDFHAIRLRNMIQVIANELEPIQPAVAILRRNLRLTDRRLRKRLSRAVLHADRHAFHRDYDQVCTPISVQG